MKNDDKSLISIGKTGKEDAPAVHSLVDSCPPLDKNSRYLYLLVCTHFNEYSMTAKIGEDLVGFISAYRHPGHDDTVFIWQVAVDSAYRKRGIASMILEQIIQTAVHNGLTYLETTVTPSNTASFNMFKKLADTYNADFQQSKYFSGALLGDGHEEEILLRIGPLKLREEKENANIRSI